MLRHHITGVLVGRRGLHYVIIIPVVRRDVPIEYRMSAVNIVLVDAANTLGSLGVLRPGKTTFQPDDEVTRAEFVRCVAQFFPLREDAEQFADVVKVFVMGTVLERSR